MAKNNKDTLIGVASVIGVTGLLAAGGWLLYSNLVKGKELMPLAAAQLIPDEAIATTYISTDSKKWSELSEFGTPEFQDIISSGFQNLENEIQLGDSSTPIDYQKDIEPWLGGAMLAFFPPSPQSSSNNYLMIVGIKDKLKAWQFFKNLQEDENSELVKTEYKGFTILEIPINNTTNYAVEVGKYWAISGDKNYIEDVIDTKKGELSFASKSGAKSILSKNIKSKDSLIEFYLPDYSELIRDTLLLSPNANQIPDEIKQQLEDIESLVVGFSVEDVGVRFRSVAKVNPRLIDGDLYKPVKSNLISRFPQETIMFLNGQGISKGWAHLVEISNSSPEIKQGLDYVRSSFESVDLDLDREIFGWLDGEFAVGIIASEQTFGNIGSGVVMLQETSDRATGTNTIEKIEKLNGNPFIKSHKSTKENIEITEWRINPQEVLFTHGWFDNNNLAIGLGIPFQEILDGKSPNSLVENPKFQTVISNLPKNNLGYFYLDMEKAVSALNQIPETQPYLNDEMVLQILNSIEAIGATTAIPDNSTAQFDLLFSLEK